MPLRKIEVFTAGCSLCDDAVQLVHCLVCESCEVEVLDMGTLVAQRRAKDYGVTRVPAIVVNGRLAACCQSGPVDEATLRALGVGSPA